MSTKIITRGAVFASLFSCALLVSALTMTPESVGGQGSIRLTCTMLQSDLLRYRSSDGITGGEVTQLQNFLVAKGLLNTQPTGYFGLGTFAAVRSYQVKNGLSQSGYVGVLTKAKIKEESCNLPTTQPVTPSATGVDVSKTQTTPGSAQVTGGAAPTPLPIKKIIDIPSCLTLEYRACPDGTPMPHQGCSWYPERCGATTTPVQSVPSQTAKVTAPPQTVIKQVVEVSPPKAVACTMVMRLCPDGSAMPRDAGCGWHPEQCPSDVGGMQCTKDSFTGQVTCGAPGAIPSSY